ncbi:MAG TPA: glycosyltransferase family 4 protein, partial [Bacteroidota bacterium]|nr:glycosyltransferase family 4 protein [Bacteroidota bacterium]
MSRSILITNASSIYAGGEYYVLLLATELLSRGHRVAVSCRPDNLLLDKCRAQNIPVLPADFPSTGKLFKNVLLLKRIIGREKIDIVHTNTNYDRTAGAMAARLAGVKHVANIHSFHSISHNLTHRLRNRYWTDRFITVGECVKGILVRDDGIPIERISTVHLGLDPEIMQRSAELRARARAEFRLGEGEILLGNVGR